MSLLRSLLHRHVAAFPTVAVAAAGGASATTVTCREALLVRSTHPASSYSSSRFFSAEAGCAAVMGDEKPPEPLPPPGRSILVRDFIRSALYDPYHGYFSKRSGSVGVLDRGINFNQLQGRGAYMKHLDNLYKKHDISWFTPVELFKPWYAHGIAEAILRTANLSVPLKIYEIGGGSGTCAKCIMDYMMLNAPPKVYSNMTYISVEISSALAKRQCETVGDVQSHLSRFRVECRDAADRTGWGVSHGVQNHLRVGPISCNGYDLQRVNLLNSFIYSAARVRLKTKTSNATCGCEIVHLKQCNHCSATTAKCHSCYSGGLVGLVICASLLAPASATGHVDPQPCWVIMLEVLDNLPHDVIYSPNQLSQWMEVWLENIQGSSQILESYKPVEDPLIARCIEIFGMDKQHVAQGNKIASVAKHIWSKAFPKSQRAWMPTGCLQLLEVLHWALPKMSLIASDFSYLPDVRISGDRAPLVSTKKDGCTIDHNSYLDAKGDADVFFPTDFWLLERMDHYCSEWQSQHRDAKGSNPIKKRRTITLDTASFMEEFGLPSKTRTKDGYNPLLDDFKNTKFYLSVPTYNIK